MHKMRNDPKNRVRQRDLLKGPHSRAMPRVAMPRVTIQYPYSRKAVPCMNLTYYPTYLGGAHM